MPKCLQDRGMATTKTYKAAAYLRVSGFGQADGDGFDRQRDAVNRYAKAVGFDVVGEWTDAGVSGKTELADRAGLAALLDRIDSNGVRTVIVERADRIARDLMVSEIILQQFRERGVRVIAAEGGVDLTNNADPTTNMVRQILGAVAEFDRRVIVDKLRAARDRRSASAGRRVEGRKPFGTRPGESETVETMRRLRRKPRGGRRMSFAAIAAELDRQGRPTRGGGRWTAEAVRKIVTRKTKAVA